MNIIKFWFCVIFFMTYSFTHAQNVFSIKGNKTYMNDRLFQAIGLRFSNALLSDSTTNEVIAHLDEYMEYGINSISVYFMGSRYSDINGYNIDATLKDVYKNRMAKIIEACDKRQMLVVVGILYWGIDMGKFNNMHYAEWQQEDVNNALCNTLKWIKERNYKNILVDPDNEGMAERGAGFNTDEMICKGKAMAPDICIAYNGLGYPPPCADLSIHFANKTLHLPYIETEGTSDLYWSAYSKEKGLGHYINVGIYTSGKKAEQLTITKELLDAGYGYFFASTWLQNVPPNFHVGGDGTPCNPGMKWWLSFIKDNYKNK